MSHELKGVTFPAWRDAEFVTLAEILQVIDRWLEPGAHWRLTDAEFAPGWRGSEQLHALANRTALISTQLLSDLVSDGVQMVDGSIDCFRDTDSIPFISLRSVRGDAWDVFAEREVLDAVRRAFEMAEEIPC